MQGWFPIRCDFEQQENHQNPIHIYSVNYCLDIYRGIQPKGSVILNTIIIHCESDCDLDGFLSGVSLSAGKSSKS
jgi:hypothetical protein